MNKNITKINNQIKLQNYSKNVKNQCKNSKNLIKITQKQQILKDFVAWLDGIQEDEPIPLEVKYIYFILDFSQNDIVFSYSGDENFLSFFDLGFYAPLEGQYFDCGAIKSISKEIFENKKNKLKKEIFELLKDIVYSTKNGFWFLKDKIILFGKRFNIINYKNTKI